MKDDLVTRIKDDKFAKYVGIKILEVREGYAEAELNINENHLNGVNRVQGGVIFTLADFAFAAASNSTGFATVALNVSISFFNAPTGKKIKAVAREFIAQNRIAGCKVDIIDEDGTLVACFNGLGYRKI